MENQELIINEAIDTFGSEEKAYQWLNKFHNVMGAKPIDYLGSEHGFNSVMEILSSIKYSGVV